MTLLQSGVVPLYLLKVRRGKDSRLVRVVNTDSSRFYCVFADSPNEEKFMLAHDSIKHGTFILEEVEEVTAT